MLLHPFDHMDGVERPVRFDHCMEEVRDSLRRDPGLLAGQRHVLKRHVQGQNDEGEGCDASHGGTSFMKVGTGRTVPE